MQIEPLASLVERYLGALIERRGFDVKPSKTSEMGEEWVLLDSEDFEVSVSRDRGGMEWIEVGSKARPKPRAPLRSYSLRRLIAYLDGAPDPNRHVDLEAEARWLVEHQERVLDARLLNSEELRLWNVDASRRLFGQEPRKR